MIPVRVPSDTKPGFISERRFILNPDHPLYDIPCPACDRNLGGPDAHESVLIVIGISPEEREREKSYVNAGAVAVHSKCAGV